MNITLPKGVNVMSLEWVLYHARCWFVWMQVAGGWGQALMSGQHIVHGWCYGPWSIGYWLIFHTPVYMKHPNGFIIVCAKKYIGSDIKCLMKFSYQVVLGRPVE